MKYIGMSWFCCFFFIRALVSSLVRLRYCGFSSVPNRNMSRMMNFSALFIISNTLSKICCSWAMLPWAFLYVRS